MHGMNSGYHGSYFKITLIFELSMPSYLSSKNFVPSSSDWVGWDFVVGEIVSVVA